MREFLGAARPQTPRCVFHIYDTGHKAPYYTISPTIFGNVTLLPLKGTPATAKVMAEAPDIIIMETKRLIVIQYF